MNEGIILEENSFIVIIEFSCIMGPKEIKPAAKKTAGKGNGKKANDSTIHVAKRNQRGAKHEIPEVKTERKLENMRKTKGYALPPPDETLLSINARKRTRKASCALSPPNKSQKLKATSTLPPTNKAKKPTRPNPVLGSEKYKGITLYPIGQEICKHFSGFGTFYGHVEKHPTSNNPFYDVVYTDGDSESIDVDEICKYVLYPIGQNIQKHFPGHGVYHGKVKEHPSSPHPFYLILYNDGDAEHIHVTELHKYVAKAEIAATTMARTPIRKLKVSHNNTMEKHSGEDASHTKTKNSTTLKPVKNVATEKYLGPEGSTNMETLLILKNESAQEKRSREAASHAKAKNAPASNPPKIFSTKNVIDIEDSKNIETLLKQLKKGGNNKEKIKKNLIPAMCSKFLYLLPVLSVLAVAMLALSICIGSQRDQRVIQMTASKEALYKRDVPISGREKDDSSSDSNIDNNPDLFVAFASDKEARADAIGDSEPVQTVLVNKE
mmetsp:Transcript_16363/g.24112  ORF Transcript_16363/g.24112 Transcript_16363/m.24112 type:complete len:494 (+) Transcript_16363:61-1542(+)